MVWFNVFLIYCQGQHVVLEGDLCKRLNEDNYKHFWFCTSSRNKKKKNNKKKELTVNKHKFYTVT